ncbi:MAG TPA: hypothetical protein VHN99_07925 [Deinococcales bacterium]|nr:hypothetical protein [Deinococcales bacterium]
MNPWEVMVSILEKIVGPKGPPGPRGVAGLPGPSGDPATLAVIQQAQAKIDEMNALKASLTPPVPVYTLTRTTTGTGQTQGPFTTIVPNLAVADNTTLASLGWTLPSGSGLVTSGKTHFSDYAFGWPSQPASLNTTLQFDARLDVDAYLHISGTAPNYQYLKCQFANSGGNGVVYVYYHVAGGGNTFIRQINLKNGADGAGAAQPWSNSTVIPVKLIVNNGNQLRLWAYFGGAWYRQDTQDTAIPAGWDVAGFAGLGNEAWATNTPGIGNISIGATDTVTTGTTLITVNGLPLGWKLIANSGASLTGTGANGLTFNVVNGEAVSLVDPIGVPRASGNMTGGDVWSVAVTNWPFWTRVTTALGENGFDTGFTGDIRYVEVIVPGQAKGEPLGSNAFKQDGTRVYVLDGTAANNPATDFPAGWQIIVRRP